MSATRVVTTPDFTDSTSRIPIGAADLKANAQRLFRKALIISAVLPQFS